MESRAEKITPKIILAIIAAGLMSFSGVIVETAMNITFPTLMKEFSVTTGTVQWLTTGYLLLVAIMVPLSATLKRKFKTKNLFLVANLLFIVGLIIDASAPSFALLLLGRIIQGIGTGIALPLMFNIILEQVPLQKIGMMMGIGTLITAVAPAIGPTFGGILVATLGWRFIFIFLIPILLVSLVLGLVNIEQKSEIVKARIDILSVLLIVLTFVGLVLGISNLSSAAFLSFSVGGAIVIGLVALWLLVVRSNHLETPIIDLYVLKNLNFSSHVLAFFLFQLISLGLSFILPNYIQIVNHSTSTVAGLVVLPGAVLGAIFAPVGGRILDRYGAKIPLMTGAIASLLAVIFLSILGKNLSNVMIIFLYLLFMLGIGLSFGNLMTNGLKQLEKHQSPDGNALLTTMQQFAGATGTSIVAAIIAQSQSASHASQAVSTAAGSQNAFIVLLVCLVIEFLIMVKVLFKPYANHTK